MELYLITSVSSKYLRRNGKAQFEAVFKTLILRNFGHVLWTLGTTIRWQYGAGKLLSSPSTFRAYINIYAFQLPYHGYI